MGVQRFTSVTVRGTTFYRGTTVQHGTALQLFLRYLIVKEVFWYELPRTLRGLAVGVRRLYLPSGVMNQVSDTKNRVVKA